MPTSVAVTDASIANTGLTGQGTLYFSYPWNSYVWIGGPNDAGGTFSIMTSPEPHGPWLRPYHIYTAPIGNYSISAYSLQAHPALTSNPMNNSIFLTYTKNDLPQTNPNSIYTTPLIYIEWQWSYEDRERRLDHKR